MVTLSFSVAHYRPTIGASDSRLPRGFTLIELLVAVVLLSLGLLAMASVAGAVVRLERAGERLSFGASAAETRLELLRAAPCASASGSGTHGAVSEHWIVAPVAAGVSELVDSVFTSPWPHGAAGGALRVDMYRSASRC